MGLRTTITGTAGCLLAVAALALPARQSLATDGVFEINQTLAAVGGTTASDQPGFPVTIDRSGSYRLTDNLVVSDADTDAIEITATDGNVTIDLNGFEVSGPISCNTMPPVLCSPAGTGRGIFSASSHITIRNGSVRGFGFIGIYLVSDSNVIEDLRVYSNGNAVILYEDATVRRSIVVSNGGLGINAGDNLTVRQSWVDYNGGIGVSAGSGAHVLESQVRENSDSGLHLGAGAVVRDTIVLGNGQYGIIVGDHATVAGSIVEGNGVHGILAGDGARLFGNVAHANGETFGLGSGISAGKNALVSVCNTSGNETTGISVGINSRLLENLSSANQVYGIAVGEDTGYARNVLVGNTSGDVDGAGIQLGPNLCSSGICP